jgi:hypothetical protein
VRLALAGALAAVAAIVGVSRADAGVTLVASPNPVEIPFGTTTGTTTIYWHTGSVFPADLWVSVNGGPETSLVVSGPASGSRALSVTYGSSYVVRLYQGPRSLGVLLASRSVTTTRPPALTYPGVIDWAVRTRRVDVTYTRIEVIEDGDDRSGGEVTFWLLVNGAVQQTSETRVRSGDSISLDRMFSVDDAPTMLTLRVTGFDDDKERCGGLFSGLCRCGLGSRMPETTGHSECGDTATVIRTIDVSGPATTGSFEFLAEGGKLRFRVFGTYTVSYHV